MRLPSIVLTTILAAAPAAAQTAVPAKWLPAESVRYLDTLQVQVRSASVAASGKRGAVTVSYGPFAARAGLAVLEHGGNAMDAALTTAVTQVAVTAGAPVSYFGILALVYYDAKTGTISTMNAGWNTIQGDRDPLTIPGSIDLGANVLGTAVSGRTALVGGFMRGVESAHRKFGRRHLDRGSGILPTGADRQDRAGEAPPRPDRDRARAQGRETGAGVRLDGIGPPSRTFQGLANVLLYGMTVDQAIDSPDHFLPSYDAKLGGVVQPVPAGRFPATGLLRAASNNRNNSIAVAY